MVTDDFYSLFRPPPEEARPFTPPSRRDTREGVHSYAEAALRSEAELVAGAPEGTRNHTLNKAWFNMGRHVGAGSIDAQTVRDTLADAARAAGLDETEIDLVLRDGPTSALQAGTAVPRIPAPLPDLPEATILEDSDPADPDSADDAEDPGSAVERFLPVLDFHQLFATDDDGEEWIIEPLLAARRMVALFSKPKVGKSLLMLEVAVGIALGTTVLGVTPDRPRRVAYVDFENDPRGDIKRRLEAMGYGPEDADALNEGLRYLSFPTLAKLDTQQGALQLLAFVRHHECEVVVIDTISRAVAGEENDNDTWLAFYRNTGLALKQAEVACIRLDHSGKDAEKGMRGGSAKYGDVDAVWRLSAASETVLELECTDHRMPIDNPHLTIVREASPDLHHRVAEGGVRVALDAEDKQIMTELDALAMPRETSGNDLYKALKEAGKGHNRQRVLRVVKLWRMRLSQPDRSGSGTTPEPSGTTGREVVPGSRLQRRDPEPPAAGTGTTPGTGSFEPLAGKRKAAAWTAAADTLSDGAWHSWSAVVDTMLDASDVEATTCSNLIRDAAANGWIERRGEHPDREVRVTRTGRAARPELRTPEPDHELVACKRCHTPTDATLAATTGRMCMKCFTETGQTLEGS